jgi:26S proteasome regulatory subunit N3
VISWFKVFAFKWVNLHRYAKECLTQAHRKAPALAKGFSIELVKWITVVRLLLGEIPEKKDLTEGGAGQRAALKPYLDLTQAVRLGDLEKFRAVMDTHGGFHILYSCCMQSLTP